MLAYEREAAVGRLEERLSACDRHRRMEIGHARACRPGARSGPARQRAVRVARGGRGPARTPRGRSRRRRQGGARRSPSRKRAFGTRGPEQSRASPVSRRRRSRRGPRSARCAAWRPVPQAASSARPFGSASRTPQTVGCSTLISGLPGRSYVCRPSGVPGAGVELGDVGAEPVCRLRRRHRRCAAPRRSGSRPSRRRLHERAEERKTLDGDEELAETHVSGHRPTVPARPAARV